MNIIIPDIDPLIINLLDLPELAIMVSTNKYFHSIVVKIPLYIQWRDVRNEFPNFKPSSLFQCLCKKGYLDYAISLIQRHQYIDIHNINEYAFQLACRSGNLDLCKWLINLDQTRKIDIHTDGELAFIWSCKFGHIDIAKWLIDLGEKTDSRINIHGEFGRSNAFSGCCEGNYLGIAKYLIYLGENGYGRVNVHRFNTYLKCYQRGYTDIVNWLLMLDSSYGVHQLNQLN